MGTTPKGLPYPAETAYVKDGGSAMHAMASATDDALGGALFRATVASEAVAGDGVFDRLELTLTVDDSPLFTNTDGNLITYTGPRVVATLYSTVTWEGDAAGTRKQKFVVDGVDYAEKRVTPDSQPITDNNSWPVILTSGDKIGLSVAQTAGHSLNVTSARFRCVINGVAP